MRQFYSYCSGFVFVLVLLVSTSANAAVVVDQSQSVINSLGIHAPVTTPVAQSFTPTYDNIVGVQIGIGPGQLDSVSVSLYQQIGSMSILLQDVNNNNASATTAGGIPTSSSTSNIQYAQIDFDASVSLTAGNSYFLVFSGTFTGGDPNTRAFAGHFGPHAAPDNYAGGIVYTSPLITGGPVNQNSLDLAFTTLSSNVTAVPEPSSAVILLGSMFLIGVRRRRWSRRTS